MPRPRRSDAATPPYRVSLLLLAVAVSACGGGSAAADATGEADTASDGADVEAEEPNETGDQAADADADADAEAADADADADAVDGEVTEDGLAGCFPDPERIYDDIETLTGDDYAGRLPGTPGNELALAFAEARFAALGLEPAGVAAGFRQPFGYDQWIETGPSALEIGGDELLEDRGFALMAYSGAGTVTAEIVFAGYSMTVPPFDPASHPACPFPSTGYDDYAGLDVDGKIVLALRHGPLDDAGVPDNCPANAACAGAPCLWDFGYKAANAALHGAAALLVVQHYAAGPELPEGATIGERYYAADFPALFVDRTVVESHIPDLPVWAANIDATLAPDSHATGVTATVSASTTLRHADTANLLAIVPGTDPTLSRESVVFGAHIDHLGVDASTGAIYRGADDNASGTATVLELARSVVECGLVPARTLVFQLYNAEEAGLVGSCYYVQHPTLPLAGTAAMFSLDMVGAGDGSGLALFGARGTSAAWLATLMRGAVDAAGLDYTVLPADPLDASDHVCFAYAGVPAVLAMTIGPHDGYHTPEDTIDHIRLEDLRAASEMMWATLVPLALGTEADYLSKRSPLPEPLGLRPPNLDRERPVAQ